MRQCLYTLLAVLLFTPVFFVQAQVATCGNVVTPAGFYYPSDDEVITPIENCANPMNSDATVSFSASLRILDQAVTEGVVITAPEVTSTDVVQFSMDKSSYGSPLQIYRFDGGNYHLVYDIQSTDPAYPATFFTPGNYTAVFLFESPPIFSQEPTILQQIFAAIVPVATAYYPDYTEVKVVNFEIVTPPPAPAGASSILFLPGIMGSRLYEDSTACDGSGEQELWFSTSNCNQLRLVTDLTGKSIHPIYTKAGETSVIDTTHLVVDFPLYRSFLTALASWKQDDLIADYAAVPYDWRLRLDDLLKAKQDPSTGKVTYDITNTLENGYLYTTLKNLVATSKSGKVTIVAHSNGGLVAKTLLATLQARHDPLVDKIDVVILVAVPQVGTPDALIGVLQGSEIGPSGLVVSQQTARQLMNTMPFAHHLLPNASYFNGDGVTVTTPVVRFVQGIVTTPWVNTYGETITEVNKMQDFLRKESGRTVPEWNDLLTPAVVDGYLFNYANTIEQVMKSWVPTSTTQVYEVAGTGIDTPSGVIYYTGTACATRLLWVCTSYKPVLAYTVKETLDGDGTVLVPSALAMSEDVPNVQRLWLNLFEYNDITSNSRIHRDIFEVLDIIQFVKNTLASTTATYSYLSTSAPVFTAEDRLVFTLHSPLDMSLKLASGAVVSSSTPLVERAKYRRYGEVQTISVLDTPANKQLLLRGITPGSFTLDIEQQRNGSVTKRQTFTAIPSSTSTSVMLPLTSGDMLGSSSVAVDYDGNGSVDVRYEQSGEVVTYALVRSTISALALLPLYKNVLLQTLKIAEQHNQKTTQKSLSKTAERATLLVLKQQLLIYVKLKLLSPGDHQKIVNMVNVLISKLN